MGYNGSLMLIRMGKIKKPPSEDRGVDELKSETIEWGIAILVWLAQPFEQYLDVVFKAVNPCIRFAIMFHHQRSLVVKDVPQ